MTTYTPIPNADVAQDKPVTQPLLTLLRDNPIAIAEGAPGAPRIVGLAAMRFADYPVLTVAAADTYACDNLFSPFSIGTLSTPSSTFVQALSCTAWKATGSVRFKWTAAASGTATVETRILKNGTVVNTFSSPGAKSQDISLVPGDVISVEVRRPTGTGSDAASVTNIGNAGGLTIAFADDTYQGIPLYRRATQMNVT